MTDQVQLTTALADLKTTADRLNAASDEINAIIENVERQIAATNVGIFAELRLWADEDADEAADLIWTKWGDQWLLAVSYLTAGGSAEAVCKPLASASRDDRIRALEVLPKFIAELTATAEKRLAAIENARKLGE